MPAIKWVDESIYANGRCILTEEELKIPGVRMFGRHHTPKAIPALQPHFHENSFEFTYLSKGSVRFSVDNRIYQVFGGHLFVIHPDEVHDTDSHPMSMHVMYWFQLDISDPKRFLHLEEGMATRVIALLKQLPMRVLKLDENKACSILADVFAHFRSLLPHQREAGSVLLLYFLYFVIESADRLLMTLQPDIGRVASYVLDHLDEELSMEQLARVANLSVSRFKQKFKDQMGLPPREYVNSERMRAAEILLQEGNSVMQTAMELGFSSSNYFAVVFRRHMGCAPREYLSQRMKGGR